MKNKDTFMKVDSNFVLKALKVMTWAGFIGLCIKAGSILFSFWVSIYINAVASKNLYMGLDLSQLKEHNIYAYNFLVILILTIIIIQALMFFILIKIFKHINLVSPFHEKIRQLILKLSIYSMIIGIISKLTYRFSSKFIEDGMHFPNLFEHVGHGDAFLFFAGIIFFISMLFKRGIELQTENDLTI